MRATDGPAADAVGAVPAEQLAKSMDERIDMVRELFEGGRAVAVVDLADDAGRRRCTDE